MALAMEGLRPKAGGLVHVAGIVAAHERHVSLLRIRNAGAIVFDIDGELIARHVKADRRSGAERFPAPRRVRQPSFPKGSVA